MFEDIGGSELLLVLLVALIFFGPKKMPELGRNVGKGIRAFKRALRDDQAGAENSMKDP